MREILYRGKRIDNNEWGYGFLVKMWGQYHIVDQNDENTAYPIEPETIGQFTGIKDKNDKNIFEGDILKIVYYEDDTSYTTEVRPYVNTLCVDVEGEDYNITAIDFAKDIWDENCCEWEVIGNIYEEKEDK